MENNSDKKFIWVSDSSEVSVSVAGSKHICGKRFISKRMESCGWLYMKFFRKWGRIRVALVSTQHRRRSSSKRSLQPTGAVPLLAPAAGTWQIQSPSWGHPWRLRPGEPATDSHFTWPQLPQRRARNPGGRKMFCNRPSRFINLRSAIKRISQLFVFAGSRPDFPWSFAVKRLGLLVSAVVAASVQIKLFLVHYLV